MRVGGSENSISLLAENYKEVGHAKIQNLFCRDEFVLI